MENFNSFLYLTMAMVTVYKDYVVVIGMEWSGTGRIGKDYESMRKVQFW